MINRRIPAAVAASFCALTYASASFADEPATTTTTTTTDSTEVSSDTAAQPAPQPTTQSVTVQQPAAQPVQPVQQPVATTTTTAAPYTYPSDSYAERTVERRPNRTLLSTGVGILVVSYGASAVAGAISDRESDKNLFIPVVGPWLDLGNRDCGTDPCGNREDINKAMLITSGVVQGAGLLMALGSLVIPESSTVTEKRSTAKVKPEVRVSPVSFRAGAGLGAIGRF